MQKRINRVLIGIILCLVATDFAAAAPPCCKRNCQCAKHVAPKAVGARSQMRVSPLAQQLRPNRVLIVTPLDRQDRLKEQVAMMRRLAIELRLRTGFDVVEASERVCEDMYPIRTGRFDERKLLYYGRKYLADTVMYCNIESIDAYCPMQLEIQFLMINVDQAVSILSGSLRVDMSDKSTEVAFYQALGADPLMDTTLKNSPTRLIDFSSTRVAADLSSIWK